MARTYRNRHAVPSGVVVRDDGVTYFSCCPTKEARRKSWRASRILPFLRGEHCTCHGHWNQYPKFRRGYYRRERKSFRKVHYREYRAKVRDRMAHEDWENIPRFRRTSGWLTW
jgi:hypothetical protein